VSPAPTSGRSVPHVDIKNYDLVIIGTGSANSILDERFDQWSVAMVERDAFGGTCLNRGCVPSKMFVYPADVIMELRQLGALGVDADLRGVRWREMRDRIFGRIDPIAESGADYRRSQPNVDVHHGDARFVGHKRLEVTLAEGSVTTLTGDRFVIAAGARPTVPDTPGYDTVGIHTSDTIMRIDEVPRRLAVIGGGFVAVEQAHIFDAFGSEVTMIVRGSGLLTAEDEEVSARFTAMAANRFDLRPGTTVVAATRDTDGVTLITSQADGSTSGVVVDQVLVATGRTPNGAELDVGMTGVALDADGLVITDDRLATEVEGIWALGDVRSVFQLKHVANHETTVVQHNLLYPDSPIHVDERFVPHAVFGHPQIASVGQTEQELRGAGCDYLVGRRDHGDTAYGWAMEDSNGFVKVLVDPLTRELLGAHILGHQAAILLQQLVQGMRSGLTIDVMARHQMYPHPTLAEVVENALLDA